MTRALFILIAILFLGGGIVSTFASHSGVPNPVETGRQTEFAAVDHSPDFALIAQTLTRNDHLNILVRMGFFYAGFICILLAFDLGDRKPEDLSEPSNQ